LRAADAAERAANAQAHARWLRAPAGRTASKAQILVRVLPRRLARRGVHAARRHCSMAPACPPGCAACCHAGGPGQRWPAQRGRAWALAAGWGWGGATRGSGESGNDARSLLGAPHHLCPPHPELLQCRRLQAPGISDHVLWWHVLGEMLAQGEGGAPCLAPAPEQQPLPPLASVCPGAAARGGALPPPMSPAEPMAAKLLQTPDVPPPPPPPSDSESDFEDDSESGPPSADPPEGGRASLSPPSPPPPPPPDSESDIDSD
jgi:hypothetical protein